mmetsp:Transcript_77624/g.202053  ORF Transcript_77624/g.202053 Transcript_77624/m.202053 type:complete len:470 (+) Transcript_77624:177-1586(+)
MTRWMGTMGRTMLEGVDTIEVQNQAEIMKEAANEAGNRSLAGRITGRFLHFQEEEERRGAQDDPDRRAEVRRNFMVNKLHIDATAINHTHLRATRIGLPGRTKQVAFLFLAMDSLDFEDVWDEFFVRATIGSYSIYIHRAAENSGEVALPLARWGAIDIDTVENGWCALMGVETALLANALQDARNVQMVFVSHNTVPLKGFDYIYRQLVENSQTTSKFCFADKAWHKMATPETIRNELRRQCIFRDFYRELNPRTLKHHQWVVLARAHAQVVVKRAGEALYAWKNTWGVAAPDLGHMGEGCSDEAVPGTALLQEIEATGRSTGNTWADLTRLGVEQQCLTYVLWRHCFTDTALNHSEPIAKELGDVIKYGKVDMLTSKDFDFFKSALKRELNGYPTVFQSLEMDYLLRLSREGFMFARKFKKGIRVTANGIAAPLEVVLPAIWDKVDEQRASQRVWSRLSTQGVPTSI